MFRVTPSLEPYQVPLAKFLSKPSEARPTKVVVGSLIFSKAQRILLLQRAASERHFPNIWKLPSGKVKSDDPTLLHAAARECSEETGLIVTAFTAAAKSFEYNIEGGGTTLQLNFITEVHEGDPVIVNPVEHQAFAW